jgi:hypothetical protein
MTLYAKVEEGSVVWTGNLPKNTANVSGFHMLSDADKKAHGYLPLTMTMPEVNTDTQKLGDVQYTVNANDVSGTYAVVNLAGADLASRMANCVDLCKKNLMQCLYNTDWTELASAGLTAGQKTKYDDFRANLRTAHDSIETFNHAQLCELRDKMAACQEDCCCRMFDFTADMTAFEGFLSTLLGA